MLRGLNFYSSRIELHDRNMQSLNGKRDDILLVIRDKMKMIKQMISIVFSVLNKMWYWKMYSQGRSNDHFFFYSRNSSVLASSVGLNCYKVFLLAIKSYSLNAYQNTLYWDLDMLKAICPDNPIYVTSLQKNILQKRPSWYIVQHTG